MNCDIHTLATSAMMCQDESALESWLSALEKASVSSDESKKHVCDVSGFLEFIITLLVCDSPAIVESGSGILKNISSYISLNDYLRQILRQGGCLQILIQHLRSSDIKIVENICGILLNLSTACTADQNTLIQLGGVAALGQLVNSEHKTIAMASSAALNNLITFKMSNNLQSKSLATFERNQRRDPFLDEPIDFSQREREFYERHDSWQSQPASELLYTNRHFPYYPNANFLVHNFGMTSNNSLVDSMPLAINSSVCHLSAHNYLPTNLPEHPTHFCTEDTPSIHSMYNGSLNIYSNFNTIIGGQYPNIPDGNDLINNQAIDRELGCYTPKEYSSRGPSEGISVISPFSKSSMESINCGNEELLKIVNKYKNSLHTSSKGQTECPNRNKLFNLPNSEDLSIARPNDKLMIEGVPLPFDPPNVTITSTPLNRLPADSLREHDQSTAGRSNGEEVGNRELEFDDSSSFSFDSNECGDDDMVSINHCIELAMPKSYKGSGPHINCITKSGLKNVSVETRGNFPDQDKSINSNFERSGVSEGNSEMNNTVIYKEPKDFLNDADIVGDVLAEFLTRTTISNLDESRYVLESIAPDVQDPEAIRKHLNDLTYDTALSIKKDLAASRPRKKASLNGLIRSIKMPFRKKNKK